MDMEKAECKADRAALREIDRLTVNVLYLRDICTKKDFYESEYCNLSFALAHFYCAFSATQKICQYKWILFDAFTAWRPMRRTDDMPAFPLGKCV